MKPKPLNPLHALLSAIAMVYALTSSASALAQSQFPAVGQSTGLRPPISGPGPSRMGPVTSTLGTTPAPDLTGQASKTPSPGGDVPSVRVLTKSEAASQASKLLVAKAQFMEQAKQTGASPDKANAAIANLQAGDSVKLSLLTPRHAWANLVVERPDTIDFDAGALHFDNSVKKVNAMPGHPACKFTAPTEGYYMVDVLVEMANDQKIVTWTTPHEAADHRAKEVSQLVQGGVNHILVSIQASKQPTHSMVQTVQIFGAGRYTFKSCEITRLK